MAEFTGKLLDSDGSVLGDVTGNMYAQQGMPGGMKSWSGWLDGAGVNVSVGVKYRLQLDDGRAGGIFIKRMQLPSGTIEFQGVGPLK